MLSRRPRTSLLFALALAAATLPSGAFAGEAQDQFDKGNAAFEAEKFADALAAYKAAWKITKTHDLAYMMGRTEMELGMLRDAAEHFSYALAHFPLTGDPELRDNVETALSEVKKGLVTVRIKSTTKDITITLDGVKLEASSLDTELFLEPGRHTIEGVAPGFRNMRRPMDFKGGDDELVTMNLVPESSTPRNPIPGYAMAGLGVVGLVAGVVLVGAAEGKKGEAMALHEEIGSADKCQADAEKCQLLRDTTAATDGLGNGGIAAMVFGGLFGAAALGYLLIPSRNKSSGSSPPPPTRPLPKKPALVVVPVAAASAGGVLLSGSF